MYQVNAHSPSLPPPPPLYFREEENKTINLNSSASGNRKLYYDFQWQCGLFYFEKDRQDVYAWKLPAFFCLSF